MSKVFFFLDIDERTQRSQDQIVASHSFAQRSVLQMISHHEINKTKKNWVRYNFTQQYIKESYHSIILIWDSYLAPFAHALHDWKAQ